MIKPFKNPLSDETKIRSHKWKEIKLIAMDRDPELTNWFVSSEFQTMTITKILNAIPFDQKYLTKSERNTLDRLIAAQRTQGNMDKLQVGPKLTKQRKRSVVNQNLTQEISLPSIKHPYSITSKRQSLDMPRNKILMSANIEEVEQQQLESILLSQRKMERKRAPSSSIQTTSMFTAQLGNAMFVVKTRPRFLGGQYSSKINDRVGSKFLEDHML